METIPKPKVNKMSDSHIPFIGNKRRKSVKLSKEELKALKNFHKQFHTDQECAETIGILRATLIRVLWAGSASPETVFLIRQALQQ